MSSGSEGMVPRRQCMVTEKQESVNTITATSEV